jgi:hypothetical protein
MEARRMRKSTLLVVCLVALVVTLAVWWDVKQQPRPPAGQGPATSSLTSSGGSPGDAVGTWDGKDPLGVLDRLVFRPDGTFTQYYYGEKNGTWAQTGDQIQVVYKFQNSPEVRESFSIRDGGIYFNDTMHTKVNGP